MKKWWEMTRKFQENEHNTILNKTKIPKYSLNRKIQEKPSNKNKNRWKIPDSIFFFSFSGQRKEKGKRRGCLCNPNRRNTPLYCGSFGPRISVCWKLKKRKKEE